MCRRDDFPPFDEPYTPTDENDPPEFPHPSRTSVTGRHMVTGLWLDAGLDSIGLPMGPILLPSSFIDDRYEWQRLNAWARNAWEKLFHDLTS